MGQDTRGRIAMWSQKENPLKEDRAPEAAAAAAADPTKKSTVRSPSHLVGKYHPMSSADGNSTRDKRKQELIVARLNILITDEKACLGNDSLRQVVR